MTEQIKENPQEQAIILGKTLAEKLLNDGGKQILTKIYGK
jgi:hydroxymethylbilane synthase